MIQDPISQLPALAGAQPRFHQFRIGAIAAVALSEGGIPIPPPPGSQTPPALRPLACLLLRMPDSGKLVLIDTGFGPVPKRAGKPLPTAGKLLTSMAGAGIQPADISAVLISHIHPDHVGGLFDDQGDKIFPNASYHVGSEELAFWSQEGLDLNQYPPPLPLKEEMTATAAHLLSVAGDHLTTFKAGEEAFPGIGTMLLPGHTFGQVGFMITSGDDKMLYTADALTTPEISLHKPNQQNAYDLDPVMGVKTRVALLGTLSTQRLPSFTPHFPWPNIGQVQAEGQSFSLAPTA